MTVDDAFAIHQERKTMRVFIKNTNLILYKTLVHQKVLNNKKTIHPKKLAQVKTKKSAQVVASDQSLEQPNNGKQAPREKAKTQDSNKEKQAKKKKICILGNSMIKHLKGQGLYVQPFTSAKIRNMKDYAKPWIREDNPDHIILYVGTNELSSENDAERVGKSTVDLSYSETSQQLTSQIADMH